MPILQNARRERFCQLIASGLARDTQGQGISQRAAYEASGYKATGPAAAVCASRMLRYANTVIWRIKELQEANGRRREVTVDSITTRLELASRIAEEDRLPAALTNAETAIAKLHGVFVDRQEQGKPGDFSNTQSTSELADKLIKDAIPGIQSIKDTDRALIIGEIERHSGALAAAFASIRAGEVVPSPKPKPIKPSSTLSH